MEGREDEYARILGDKQKRIEMVGKKDVEKEKEERNSLITTTHLSQLRLFLHLFCVYF